MRGHRSSSTSSSPSPSPRNADPGADVRRRVGFSGLPVQPPHFVPPMESPRNSQVSAQPRSRAGSSSRQEARLTPRRVSRPPVTKEPVSAAHAPQCAVQPSPSSKGAISAGGSSSSSGAKDTAASGGNALPTDSQRVREQMARIAYRARSRRRNFNASGDLETPVVLGKTTRVAGKGITQTAFAR